jgi:hypothetical protein
LQYIYFYGKIRGPIPYQPAYCKPETPEEEELIYDPTMNYDPRMHQVRDKKILAFGYNCF